MTETKADKAAKKKEAAEREQLDNITVPGLQHSDPEPETAEPEPEPETASN